jgi:chromosome segregation ATPase
MKNTKIKLKESEKTIELLNNDIKIMKLELEESESIIRILNNDIKDAIEILKEHNQLQIALESSHDELIKYDIIVNEQEKIIEANKIEIEKLNQNLKRTKSDLNYFDGIIDFRDKEIVELKNVIENLKGNVDQLNKSQTREFKLPESIINKYINGDNEDE